MAIKLGQVTLKKRRRTNKSAAIPLGTVGLTYEGQEEAGSQDKLKKKEKKDQIMKARLKSYNGIEEKYYFAERRQRDKTKKKVCRILGGVHKDACCKQITKKKIHRLRGRLFPLNQQWQPSAEIKQAA